MQVAEVAEVTVQPVLKFKTQPNMTPRLSSPPQSTCVCTPKLIVTTSAWPLHKQILAFLTQQDRDSPPPWTWRGRLVITATIGVTTSQTVPDPRGHLHGQHCDGMWGDWGHLKDSRHNRMQRARECRLEADKRRGGGERRGVERWKGEREERSWLLGLWVGEWPCSVYSWLLSSGSGRNTEANLLLPESVLLFVLRHCWNLSWKML